ncbi:nose resistant to fluoxetine protein 6-like, partial [Zootermopsis nevadensis]|uniref:nose resistant to fluoxetine protein 6-like n=1 Tax=Zootermopsis nevadensis TaxID=136037 RepID=UPI000B8E4AB7
MLRMITAVLLFCSTADVIGSPNAYNVTESSHTEANITTIPRDVENKTMYEDYILLQDWFVAPHLLTVLLAASDKIHSSRCKTQSRLYLKELRNFTMWAAQMFDSAAKIPVGVLAGNQYHLGHYDECVEISLDAGETFGGMLEGQYCLAEIQFDTAISLEADPYTLNYDPKSSAFEKIKYKHDPSKVRRDVMHWALCTPASCSPEELNEVLKQEITKVGESHGIQFTSHISHELCHTLDHTQTLSAGDIGYLFVLISLISLLVSSTLYDYKFTTDLPENKLEPTTKNPSKMEKIFLCFSARRSVKNLFTRNSIHPALETTHGARVFFMLMIIMGHRIITYGGHPLFNAEAEERLFRSLPSMLLGNGPVVVDGFFTLSGLLLSYSLLESQSKSKRISLAKPVLVRFFRLTPSYMMLVFFHATLLHHMGSGPFWDVTVGREQRRCATNWWSNLLYINNYINVREMCMFQ